MKRKTIGLILLGIALFSLTFVSAAIVGFLSNTVTANVEVKGPIFYTGENEVLVLNERPEGEPTIDIITGIQKIDYIMLDEDAFGGIDFYNPSLKFKVDLEVNNLTIPRAIRFEFGFIKTNLNALPLCSTIFLNIENNGTLEVNCNLIEYSPQDVDKFYFSIEGRADEEIVYFIKTKDSFVEITGVIE